MEFVLLAAAAVVFTQTHTLVHAAPSIEACPPDSIQFDNLCLCNPESCVTPPCLSVLSVAVNATNTPGSCCPIYECVDCANDTMIDDKCPCAPGAILDSQNQCKCVDEEKHLVDGKCVCNPLQCKLPALCDKKSVPVTVTKGCCPKVDCKPCPADSESTQVDSDLLEDHCVCLPCKNNCDINETVVVKKPGTGFPGNCCDLYECKKQEDVKGCQVEDVLYENNAVWLTEHLKCQCQNGLSFCSNRKDEKSQSCFVNNKIIKHMENWTKEDGCTYCTCVNGEEECISHFCEVKESQIEQNNSNPCLFHDQIYMHLESFLVADGCFSCTCRDGVMQCTRQFCEKEPKKSECQPLANCNKTCTNGFKINKKGCEICKCNSIKFSQDILSKYNITMAELLNILDDYIKHRTATTTTTTVVVPTVEYVGNNAPFVPDQSGRLANENGTSSTTTEPSVVPTDKDTGYWNVALPILALLTLACIAFIFAVAMCIYKSRRKSSLDLSHGHYETVNNLNNNNTIKKAEHSFQYCDM